MSKGSPALKRQKRPDLNTNLLYSGNTISSILSFWLNSCFPSIMLRPFVVMIFVLFISCDRPKQTGRTSGIDTPAAVNQKPAERLREAIADPISSIRQKVEHINTAPLEKKHFEFMCDERMKADYFFENGEIVKVAVDFGTVGDVYAKEGYYYDNGRLIFIYEFVEGGPACEGCIKTDEYRWYIRNDKAIKYLKNKTEQKCKRCEFSASSKEYKLLQAKTADRMKEILCR